VVVLEVDVNLNKDTGELSYTARTTGVGVEYKTGTAPSDAVHPDISMGIDKTLGDHERRHVGATPGILRDPGFQQEVQRRVQGAYGPEIFKFPTALSPRQARAELGERAAAVGGVVGHLFFRRQCSQVHGGVGCH